MKVSFARYKLSIIKQATKEVKKNTLTKNFMSLSCITLNLRKACREAQLPAFSKKKNLWSSNKIEKNWVYARSTKTQLL